MTSLNVARSFLSHIGFSQSNASDLMKKLNNDMSRLMICSNKDLIACNLSLDYRLRLLRAIRCFHMEKWSKYLMNHVATDTNRSKTDFFEKLIYHLIKFHIWIIYSSWTLNYLEKYLIITQDNKENLQLFYNQLKRLQNTIFRLKQMIILIKTKL
jgi:hypothetical protein